MLCYVMCNHHKVSSLALEQPFSEKPCSRASFYLFPDINFVIVRKSTFWNGVLKSANRFSPAAYVWFLQVTSRGARAPRAHAHPISYGVRYGGIPRGCVAILDPNICENHPLHSKNTSFVCHARRNLALN